MPNTDLPEELPQTGEHPLPEEPLLDRRSAIAQARAIRREAAALEQSEKEKAAETANSILEMAAPEPLRKTIRRQMAPIPVSNASGKFSWLDDVRKLNPARSDAEEIVEKLVAESRQREEPEEEDDTEQKPSAPEILAEHIITEVQNPHAPEAIVAQVLREAAQAEPVLIPADEPEEAQEEPSEPEEPEQAAAEPEFTEEPQEEAAPALMSEADTAAETETVPEAAESADSESADEPEVFAEPESESEEEISAQEPEAAEAEESAADTTEEVIAAEPAFAAEEALQELPASRPEPEAEPQPEPIAEEISVPKPKAEAKSEPRAKAGARPKPAQKRPPESPRKPKKPAQNQKQRRQPSRAASAVSAENAAKQYRENARTARAEVRKMVRETTRSWSREADGIRAKAVSGRTQKKAARWNVGVSLSILFLAAVGMIVLERPTVSMEENRTLAKMPAFSVESYLDGSYTAGVAEYYNDTVPMRSVFKRWTQEIRKCMGLQSGAAIHGAVPAVQETPAETEPVPATTAPPVTAVAVTADPDAAAETVTETTPAPQQEEGEHDGEISSGILIVNKRGLMLFGGGETMGEPYARTLNRFKESLPDVRMYSMVVPTPCSFYTPEEYQYMISSEKANIDYINQCLVNVEPVDVYSALEKHKDEPIFMRTDHHWSSLGSFYGAEKFSAVARVPFARIEEYDKHVKEGYVGTLYGFSGNIILKENPEEFFWYVPKHPFRTTFYNRSCGGGYEADFFMNIDNVDPVSWYMVYMTGDDHVVHIESEVGNGRKLCVIKDSYGNALIPWLTSSFDEIYVIDMRYFNLNAVRFIQEKGITDVLFAMNSFSANGPNTDKIEKIRVQ